MLDPEKPSPLDAFRRSLEAAKKDRAFLRARKRQERAFQRERRQWENTQKAAERQRSISQFLDMPSVWLEKRRIQKLVREADRQYAELGALPQPPKTLIGRTTKSLRLWLARVTEDRERLWRRIAGALGAAVAVSIAGNLALFYHFTPTRPLVTVGNRVIQKREYEGALEAAAGKPVLVKIIFTELIQQAAAKAGLTPTSAQIDQRLAEMSRRGTPTPAGLDKEQIRQNIGLTLALENLRIQGLQASDAEIADYYRKNAAQIAQPARVQSILVVTRSEFEAQTAAALLAKGLNAHQMAAQPEMHVDGENDFHLDLNSLPDSLHRSVLGTALAMKPGQITTLPLGGGFLTLKCLRKDAPDMPPLSQIREQVARLVKLEKAPSADSELALLYRANRPKFDIERYAGFLDDLRHPDPTMPMAVPSAAGTP